MKNTKPIWHKLTLERDKHQCVDCHIPQSEKTLLIVHHIDESRKNGIKEMNNDLSNLVSLCKPCHAKRHGIVSNRHDIIELREAGYSFTHIGLMLNLTRQRIHQLYKHSGGKLGTKLYLH